MTVNADTDMTRQSRQHFQIFFRVLFSRSFFTEQHDSDQALANDQRQQQIDFNGSKGLVIFEEALRSSGRTIQRHRRSKTR